MYDGERDQRRVVVRGMAPTSSGMMALSHVLPPLAWMKPSMKIALGDLGEGKGWGEEKMTFLPLPLLLT